jgi:flagellar biosynthesis GTPase FlhF
MVVSIPVDHPDAPVQGGLVRGQYESVEMIREIPVAKSKSNSTSNLTSIMETDKKQRDRGSTIGSVESRGSDAKDEEVDNRDQDETTDANPVEWIMITRSDPGGGIPKFMVERGTPSSIAGDAVRFIDWVTSQEDLPSDEDETEAILDLKDDIEETATIPLDRRRSDSFTFEPSRATDTGVIAALTSVVREGLDNYAPESLQNSLSTLLPNALPTASNEGDHDDSSTEVSSLDSFASAEQFTTAPEPIPDNVRHEDVTSSSSSMLDHKSLDRVSLDSGKTSTDSKTRLDKRLAKFEEQRKKLEADLAKSHSRGNEKLKEQRYREEKDVQKARERAEREKKRREEKYTKEMQKLERKKEAEERKAEEKRKKAEDADMLSNMKRQRDQSRRMAEVLRKENEVLRERLGELQRENTLLVQRVVKLEGGKELLRDIREELGST